MSELAIAFAVTLAAQSAVRLWLATRQISAVRSHRDHVPKVFEGQIARAEQQKAADYTVARMRLGRLAVIVSAVVTAALTIGGGVGVIEAQVHRLGWSEPWQGTLLVIAVLGLVQISGLPLALWRTFVLEARFGFNRTSPRLFVVDLIKQWLLGLSLLTPLLLAVITLMDHGGETWFVWAWLLWLGGTLALTWAQPRFIAPLFNRFTPLVDPLRSRVDRLLERCGFTAKGGVFVMDGSRRSAHGNAYFTGVGRNKRIVFFDTLLERLEGQEIEAVLAHELGHFRLRHIHQRLMLSALSVLGGLALLAWLAPQPFLYEAFGVPALSSAAALLLFTLMLPAVTFFAIPARSWWSRRHERQADDFAVDHANPRDLASALVKLYRENSAVLLPDRLYSGFYDSHPSPLDRIEHLRGVGSSPPSDTPASIIG
jgi:STE24 endopeptidase